ncbi:hypothetical protein [Halocola ammonii]
MIDYQRLVWFFVVPLLTFFCIPTSVCAQQDSSFSGRIQVGNLLGDADFRYKLVNNDTVLSGPFAMRGSNLDQLSASQLGYYSFNGKFEDNLPVNNWRIEFGQYAAAGGAELIDYLFQLKVSGTQHIATGELAEGVPDGEWSHSIFQVENSATVEQVFKSQMSFEKGIPAGSFRLSGDDLTLLGMFGTDGYADDEWALNFENIPGTMEYWTFVDGRLSKIEVLQTGSSKTISVYPEKLENPKTIHLGPQFFEILKLQHILTNKTFVKFEGGMSKLMAENNRLYQRVDSLFTSLSDARFMPVFKVKVKHYPLTKAELVELDSLESRLEKMQSEIDALSENTQLNILKHSDEEVRFYLSTLSKIQSEWLTPLSRIDEYRKDSTLEFLPREYLLRVLMAGAPSPELKVEYDFQDSLRSRVFEGAELSDLDWQIEGLEAADQFSRYVHQSVTLIADTLQKKIQEQQREKELVKLEDELMLRISEFEQFIDSLQGEASGDLGELIGSLKRSANKELSKYSSIENVSSRPAQATELIACIDQMEKLALTLLRYPERDREIEQAYTDEVWNPFTSTTMTEQVKRRITEAYENVLKPYFFNEVKNNLNCQNAENWKKRIDVTHKRMLKLSESNTSRVERKLKNETDPNVVMQLLNISIK